MTQRRKRIVLVASYGLVAIFILLNLLAYIHARAMTHFLASGSRTPRPEELTLEQKMGLMCTGVQIPRPTAAKRLSDLEPGWRDLVISTPANVSLAAWYRSAGDSTPLVILFHGYAAEKSAMLPEAEEFLKLGFSVMVVDFRGSGESSEAYTTLGYREARDVADAAAYANSHFKPRLLILYGSSMGGAAVLKAIHDDTVAPDGIVVESVFDRMLTTVENRFCAVGLPAFPASELLTFWGGAQFGFNALAQNPVDYAKSVRCPVLFLHGTVDTRARLAEGKHVFDEVTAPKIFVEFQGIGHTPMLRDNPLRWQQSIRRFLDLLGTAESKEKSTIDSLN